MIKIIFRLLLSISFYFAPIFLFLISVGKIKFGFFIDLIISLFLCLIIYMRFVERNIIKVSNYKIKATCKTKIAVISDLHLGILKNQKFLKKVINKINKIKDIDALIIPGDFVYLALDSTLEKLFKPFSDLNIPIYATLGNHDHYKKEPTTRKKLKKVLKKNNVILIDNTFFEFKKNVLLVGIGSKIAHDDNISILESAFKKNKKIIVVAHNPDSSLDIKNLDIELMISGHTHGGQIRIPFIYKKIIPCKGDFNQGIYNLKKGSKLFISSGIGEVGYPLRLGIAPSIDILDIG